jgi:hypothetical protein
VPYDPAHALSMSQSMAHAHVAAGVDVDAAPRDVPAAPTLTYAASRGSCDSWRSGSGALPPLLLRPVVLPPILSHLVSSPRVVDPATPGAIEPPRFLRHRDQPPLTPGAAGWDSPRPAGSLLTALRSTPGSSGVRHHRQGSRLMDDRRSSPPAAAVPFDVHDSLGLASSPAVSTASTAVAVADAAHARSGVGDLTAGAAAMTTPVRARRNSGQQLRRGVGDSGGVRGSTRGEDEARPPSPTHQ